ncbi:MAG: hypothetical protein ACRCYU_17815 [Nocardioides sp.]
MLTIPLFLIVLFVVVVVVRSSKKLLGPVLLGTVLGLTMASTAFGPPLTGGLQQFAGAVVTALSQAAQSSGGGR